MKVKIHKVYDWHFYKGSDEYNEITSDLQRANLPVIEEDAGWENYVDVYTEISTLDDLNRLVEAFECQVVYGKKMDNGAIIIEKYDTYRE